jgi:hypothetical protein
MCIPRVLVQDSAPMLMKTKLPPPLQYPVAPFGFDFVRALCMMFYGINIFMRVEGLLTLLRVSVCSPKTKAKVV